MTTYTVTAWNEYSTKPENGRRVSVQHIEAETRTLAMNEAERMANNWNLQETRENMKVTMITCDGYVRVV